MATDPITSLPSEVVTVCGQVAVAAMPWLAACAAAVLIGHWAIRRLRSFGGDE